MKTMDVRAEALQPNDYLPGSKQTVLTVKSNRSYVDLNLRRDNGREHSKIWNAATVIRIERPE